MKSNNEKFRKPKNDLDKRFIAEKSARDYFYNHNGRDEEGIWPVTFEIFIDNESIGRFEVEFDTEPVFYATT